MKRKLLIILIAIACIFCLAFAFTACDNDGNGQNTGDIGDNTDNEHTHPMGEWTVIIKPTCTEDGMMERLCEECDYFETAPVEATGHKEVADPAVPSACNFQGKTAGSHCEVCGKVIVQQETLPPLPHTEVIDQAIAPTCSTTGLTAGIHCSVCGEIIVAQEEVAKNNTHVTVIDKAVAPTCSKEGLTVGLHCSVCGEIIVAQEKIDKTAHTPVIDKAVEPTCTEEGLTEGSHCGVCGEIIVAQKTIKRVHTFTTTNYCDECGEDGLYYIRISGGYEVSRGSIDRSLVETVTISETYENLPVTRISLNAFMACPNLKSVIIPDTVTEIGNSAFVECEKLESINIPESVKLINNYAFMECRSLTEITIGDNVETIGRHVFRYCESLKTVKLDSSLQSIGQSAFIYCSSLAEITIPASVTEMGSNVFAHCTALKSVIFENAEGWTCKFNEDEASLFGSVLSNHAKAAEYLTDTYCNYAWHSTGEHRHIYGDDNLCDDCGHDLLIYELNSDRRGYTVYGDISLANAKKIIVAREHLGRPVTAVGNNAFTFPTVGLTYSPESVILPDTVTKIGDEAFLQCLELREINLSHVEIIGEAAFLQCENLREIDLSHVKIIGDWAFDGCDNLTRVTFSDCLEVIGDYAFVYCMISNLIIPASVKEIGYRAFDITALQSVIFEDVDGWICLNEYGKIVEQFPSSALLNPAQNAVYLTKTYKAYYWQKTDGIFPEPHEHSFSDWSVVEYANCTEDGFQERSCEYCNKREIEIIPATGHHFGEWSVMEPVGCTEDGVRKRYCDDCNEREIEIVPAKGHNYNGDNFCDDCGHDALTYALNAKSTGYIVSACEYNADITHIKIPSMYNERPVTEIGERAFTNCKFILKISLPGSITKIGQFAFGACHGLTELVIPESVTEIGSNAFASCTNLAKINIPESLTEIPKYLLYNTAITSIVIPANVKKIGLAAFAGCQYLSEVIFDGNVEIIDSAAFVGCESLTSIVLPDSVTELGFCAFASCVNLKYIYLGKSLKFIDTGVFMACHVLERIDLPNGLQIIEYMAFSDCFSLKEIVIPASVTFIGYSPFSYSTALQSIIFENPVGWSCVWRNAPTVQKEFTPEELADGALNVTLFKETYKNYNWVRQDNHEHVYGNDNICDECGFDCLIYTLNEDRVSYSVYGYPFLQNSAVTINIAKRHLGLPVTAISERAFFNYANLETVYIPDSVTVIGQYAFGNCYSLSNVTLPENLEIIDRGAFMRTGISNIVIPSSVKIIGDTAFTHCTSLTEIVIPESVTNIGIGAFWGCTALESITFEGTDSWNLTNPENETAQFTAEELADSAANVELFAETYRRYAWERAQ